MSRPAATATAIPSRYRDKHMNTCSARRLFGLFWSIPAKQLRNYEVSKLNRRIEADRPTRTLTLSLTLTLWGDVCLDAVACEGSRLIRPARMLCLEGL